MQCFFLFYIHYINNIHSFFCCFVFLFNRYSLTVWTGKEDVYSVEDLLFIRENFDKSRVYYDISEPQNSEFKKAIGIEC